VASAAIGFDGEVIVRFDSVDTGRASLFIGERVRECSPYPVAVRGPEDFDVPSLSKLRLSETRVGFAVPREPDIDRRGVEYWRDENGVSSTWYQKTFNRKVEL